MKKQDLNKQQLEALEWVTFATLFKATQEQAASLVGTTKYDVKQVFKRWFGEGNRILDMMERHEGTNLKNFEELTDIIHKSIASIQNVVINSQRNNAKSSE